MADVANGPLRRRASPKQPLQSSDIRPATSNPDFWQSRAVRHLSEEDDRQIRENLCGFVRILAEWDRATRVVPSPGQHTLGLPERASQDTVRR